MKQYIGVKMILAQSMNRLDYNVYRGWELLEDENGADPGFLVEYIDGGQTNHENHDGYISWSPAEVFVNAYKLTTGMNLGLAVEAMRLGMRIARHGWNGKDMYLEMQIPDEHSKMTQPYVYMKTADDQLVPWLCSQTDLLAVDWVVVPDYDDVPF